VGVYFAAGMIEKANFYYRLFVNWTNEKIKSAYLTDNVFDFKHIKPFSRTLLKTNLPMVLFATPGMLHAGLSMTVFKEWCSEPKNTLIIPGYCVAGTLGRYSNLTLLLVYLLHIYVQVISFLVDASK
jgi:integrator complex subunit 11